MAPKYLQLYCATYSDPDFTALTMAEQQTYWTIATHEDRSWCGVAPLFPARYCAAKDATPAKAAKAIKQLAKQRFLIVDEGTGEVMVRAFIRASGLLTQPNVVIAMCRAAGKVHSEVIGGVIRAEVTRGLRELLEDGKFKDVVPEATARTLTEAFGEGFLEGFPVGFTKP